MIVVDTSALFAIYAGEADADQLLATIVRSDEAIVGAPTAFEFKLVVHRRFGPSGLPRADRILGQPPITVQPWSPSLVTLATDALARFGGRPARLNYGDCMAYAVAKSLDLPLLYKGGDFALTDVRAAL